jgi:cytochrome oxidase assembly protein ShyY1
MPIQVDRSVFPDPPAPTATMEIRGLLAAPPAAGFRMGTPPAIGTWPLLLTALDPAALGSALNKPLLPSVLLLDPQAPEGFLRDWSPNTLSPDRHRGYAVQWLGLALTVVIVTFVLTLRSRRHRRNNPHA